jgi:hypothetical protein
MDLILERIKLLLTGKAEWCDAVTGQVVEQEKMDWRTRWAIAGIHSHNWMWVRQFGYRECGCTKNPITRRLVLINPECDQHDICACCGT